MRIAVWGGGSLGLLWTARLARLFPETVLFVRTEEQRDWIREKGIRLTGLTGESVQVPVRVRWIGERLDKPFDCLFVMVKQPHLRQVAERIATFSRPPSMVVLWQNGLGQDEPFRSFLPSEALYGAVTTEGALREGPGEVRHTGTGATWIGPFSSGVRPPEDWVRLAERLREAGLRIECEPSIDRRLWEKLMVNCAINPLTALLRVPNGELIQSEDGLRLMKAVLMEAVSVARSEGISLDGEEMLERAVEVCRRTAANRSSMLQDVEKGRTTEIDWINGAVVRRGLRAGMEMPVNQSLVRLIRMLEKRRLRSE